MSRVEELLKDNKLTEKLSMAKLNDLLKKEEEEKKPSRAVIIFAIIGVLVAVAAAAYKKYRKETNDQTKTIIASTASPYKFTRSVMKAIDRKYDSMEDFALVDELSKLSNTSVPKAIEEIRTAPVLHDTVCEKDEMKEVVKKFLGI